MSQQAVRQLPENCSHMLSASVSLSHPAWLCADGTVWMFCAVLLCAMSVCAVPVSVVKTFCGKLLSACREACLKGQGFWDPFKPVKDEENKKALKLLPGILK